MKDFTFYSPTKVYMTVNFYDVFKKEIVKYNKIALVCGKTAAYKTGFVDFLKEIKGDNLFIFDEIEENPSINTVIKGGRFVRQNRCDLIVAFGGGSSLDAAKAIAAFATNNMGFYELLSQNGLPNPPIPIFAIPTTCGTGSEVNHYAIITDYEKNDKINFGKTANFPKKAFLNPEFLETLDENLIFATAFDALTHAFEGYLSVKANPFSDLLAKEAMNNICNVLKDNDLDKEHLKLLLYSSTIAGTVIMHTATTLLHAMGYYLTNNKNIHHGTANFLLLPVYMKMLRFYKVGKLLSINEIVDNIEGLVEKYTEIFNVDLRKLFTEEELKKLSKYAMGKNNVKNTLFQTTEEKLFEFLADYIL
ncbi:alcohol dehydrogenase, class IV [Deferribacter desulfuricans SSM1]|uniref:Alcohol dehydrogenase, class IV n=1 Tax=Deferribacter desulfuricans (strain DSM 14783 / JCM 11476 / NBRC 101012 / SSM1) TaxID=639282 RepID=D3PDD7_DEFDS|nr:iron-containing alcohol dehydrogenase family protein [Deferribacter desulfuricans]BAI80610.1 alcohol dehydrogenase, class IV [Deferribacter desulfuricans SSM1]